jgi:hypothetical protein
MSFSKAAVLVIGFLGAVVLGVLIGPYVTHRGAIVTHTPTSQVQASDDAAASRRAAARHAMRRDAGRHETTKREETTAAVSPSAPELHTRIKPLLNRGTDLEIASQGFRDGEQFATVAHAARNTEVPFMVLKHRVLNEGQSLTAAIRTSKPDVNAAAEARRAREQAKSDLASLAG